MKGLTEKYILRGMYSACQLSFRGSTHGSLTVQQWGPCSWQLPSTLAPLRASRYTIGQLRVGLLTADWMTWLESNDRHVTLNRRRLIITIALVPPYTATCSADKVNRLIMFTRSLRNAFTDCLFDAGSTSSWPTRHHVQGIAWDSSAVLDRWMPAGSLCKLPTMVIWQSHVYCSTDQNAVGWQVVYCCRPLAIEYITSVSAFGW